MRQLFWMVPAALAGAACASDTAREGGTWTPETAWHLEVAWTVGGADAEGDLAFGDVRGLAVDGAGRAWVLDYQAQHLVVLDTNGTLVRTVGRRGGGPGEFEGLYGVASDGTGHMWTPDYRNLRYTVFDLSGNPLSTYRRPANCWGYTWPGGIPRDGIVRDRICGRVGDVYVDYLVRYDSVTSQWADSLLIPPAPEQPDFYRFTFGNSEALVAVPFAADQRWSMTRDGGVWVGWTGDTLVYRIAPSGDTLLRIVHAGPHVPVAPEEREREIESLRQAARGLDVDVSRIPDRYPAFEQLVGDDQDHLWMLRRSGATHRVFDVFQPDGTHLGSVAIPDGIIVNPWIPAALRGNRMWLVTHDALDAPMVTRLRIVGR